MMAAWLKRKIFAPISKIQQFYEYKNGEKQLIVPEVDWNHMSLFDTSDYINNLITLTQGEGEQKRASLHTLYRSLGLDAEAENRNMRKEAIQAAISKKEAAALETLSLNELRSLDEDDMKLDVKDLSEEKLFIYNVIDTVIPEVIDNFLGGLEGHLILAWRKARKGKTKKDYAKEFEKEPDLAGLILGP
jgi:hypothetical protein